MLAFTHTHHVGASGERFQREIRTLKSMTSCSMALSAPLSLFPNPPNPKSDNPDGTESFNDLELNEQPKSYTYRENTLVARR